jgi:hypothetical protein
MTAGQHGSLMLPKHGVPAAACMMAAKAPEANYSIKTGFWHSEAKHSSTTVQLTHVQAKK